jgi:hypothetical protein
MKCFAIFLFPALLAAQVPADSLQVFVPVKATPPGTTAAVTVGLALPSGATAPAALQFTLAVPTSSVTAVTATIGTAATNASKQLSCGTLTPNTASAMSNLVCVIFGLNVTPIGAGTVVNYQVTLASSLNVPGMQLALANASAADPSGNAVLVTTLPANLIIASPCDPNGDGVFNLQDVLMIVNNAITGANCASGACNAVDIETEILVVLNQIPCPVAGP